MKTLSDIFPGITPDLSRVRVKMIPDEIKFGDLNMVHNDVETLSEYPLEPNKNFVGRFEKLDSRTIFVTGKNRSSYFSIQEEIEYEVVDRACIDGNTETAEEVSRITFKYKDMCHISSVLCTQNYGTN